MSKYTAKEVNARIDSFHGHPLTVAERAELFCMAREYASLLRERESAKVDYSHVAADLLACDWQEGDLFYVNDDPDEHKPCYLVMPDGACLVLNHHATNGVDQARAQFIADCCNQVLCPIQAPNEAVAPMLASARVPDGWMDSIRYAVEVLESEAEIRDNNDVGNRTMKRHIRALKAMLAAAPKPEKE